MPPSWMPAAHDGRVTSGRWNSTISPNLRPDEHVQHHPHDDDDQARATGRAGRPAPTATMPRRLATTSATTARARNSRSGLFVVLTATAMPTAHPHHAAGWTARGRVALIGPSSRQARRFQAA